MASKSFEKISIAFAAVLWLLPIPVWPVSYVEETLSTPPGTYDGWTSFPDGPYSLGNAFLVVPLPLIEQDSVTGVWIMEPDQQGDYEIRNLFSFRETIRAFPADIDGDGSQDLVVSFREKPVFRAYIARRDRTGGSVTDSQFIVEDSLPLGLSHYTGAGDLNGDGLAEILACTSINVDSSFITILWAEPSDSEYISYTRFDTLYLPPSSLSGALNITKYLFGDYNGDAVTDFVFRGYLFLGHSEGQFEPIELPGFTEPVDRLLGAADFDGDGLTELLGIREKVNRDTPEKIIIFGFGPENGFYAELILESNIVGMNTFKFGELTGDRYPDLVVYNDYTLEVFRGTPDSALFRVPDTLLTDLNEKKMIGPIDWNRDGLLDWMFLSPGAAITVKIQQAPLYMDKSAEVGMDFEMAGHAAAVADFNNDGYPDIYVVNGSGPNALYAGDAEGSFTEVAEEAGTALANDGISCAWGDYNNDGFVDLFVAGMSLPDKLFHNNGDGTFSDSSRILGVNNSGERITSVCWGDVNNDGWLDILLGNYDGSNMLLLNQSGRVFLDRAPGVLELDYKTESAVLVDVNLDGRLDMVTLNAEGPTRLILSTGTGFNDVTAASGLNPDEDYKKFGQTQTWGDFDRDGYPDLYITRAQDVDMLFLNRGKQSGPYFNLAFSGHHSGKYGRIASAVADFDANGAPDLFIARSSRFGDFISSPGDLLFLGDPSKDHPLVDDNASDGSEVATPENLQGLDRYVDSSLPVAGDFDLDGDLDLLLVNYLPNNPLGLFQGSPLPLSYMQNQSQVNNNLIVKLRRTNNQSIVGTRVVLDDGDKRYTSVVSGGSGRIQTGDILLFSLGATGAADSLTVYWPQGKVSAFQGPVYPGILEVVDDRRGPVITPLELPGLVPAERPLPSNVDTFYVIILVEDDSPIERVSADLYDMSSDTPSFSSILGVETDTPGVFQLAIPAPAPGDSLGYSIRARDIYHNVSVLPETSYRFFHLKISPDYIMGDIRQDGKINILDLVRLLLILYQSGDSPSEEELIRADINRDGQVDYFDLEILLTYL